MNTVTRSYQNRVNKLERSGSETVAVIWQSGDGYLYQDQKYPTVEAAKDAAREHCGGEPSIMRVIVFV